MMGHGFRLARLMAMVCRECQLLHNDTSATPPTSTPPAAASTRAPVAPGAAPPWLRLSRRVHFGDTDGAGVMHFHQLLRWCHEAWEESLERFGVSALALFPAGQSTDPSVALPIVHCRADYRQPVRCGDRLQVQLLPTALDPCSFEVSYGFFLQERLVAQGLLRHLAIEAASRRRCALPQPLCQWLEASAVAAGVRPL